MHWIMAIVLYALVIVAARSGTQQPAATQSIRRLLHRAKDHFSCHAILLW
jgi:hypothetical protein